MGKYDFNISSIINELEKTEGKKEVLKTFSNDFWKPTIEKGQENVEYKIRFLPNPDSKNGFCWVERYAHMFNFPSGRYNYTVCPKRTLNKKCYFCEMKDELYASGDIKKEELGQKRTPKLRFFYNVLIVDDPRENGKNNGQVKIYEGGSQIHEKCTKFLTNKEIDATERIFFHPTLGSNFNLVLKMKKTTNGEFQNYDDSEFARKPSSLTINGKKYSVEEAEEFIDEKCFKLNQRILSENVFKSYEELKTIYNNQGIVEQKKEKEEEEVSVNIDETINKDKIEARNPTNKKLEAEKTVNEVSKKTNDEDDEKEDDLFKDDATKMTEDEDAELNALLNDN